MAVVAGLVAAAAVLVAAVAAVVRDPQLPKLISQAGKGAGKSLIVCTCAGAYRGCLDMKLVVWALKIGTGEGSSNLGRGSTGCRPDLGQQMPG